MKKLLLLLILISSSLIAKQRYLIVHGTWTKPFSWHMPGGDFYDTLAKIVGTSHISFFLWSGKNSHNARKEAAERLVSFINNFFEPHDELVLIGHSHGGNVINLASQIMGADTAYHKRIKYLFALATPVCPNNYAPDMRVIEYMYNLFSFNDFIQPVFSLFKREYPPHERIINIDITIDGKEPMHTELHHPAVARWIPELPSLITDFSNPACIAFFSDKAPICLFDLKRTEKLERDLMIQLHLNDIARGNSRDY